MHRGVTCFAILNRFPYATGHTLVLPLREVAELEDLTDAGDVRAVGVRDRRRPSTQGRVPA